MEPKNEIVEDSFQDREAKVPNGADVSSASRNTVLNDGCDSGIDKISSINAFPSYDTLCHNVESKCDRKVPVSNQVDKQNELECLGNCERPNKFTEDCLQEEPTVLSYKQENAPASCFHVGTSQFKGKISDEQEELSFQSTPISGVDGQREVTGLLKAEGLLAEATDKSDHAVEIDIHEYEKVCDTCGDAGYRHLLALCSKCTDGAEHIYCMRVKLHELPGAEWMCQECLLSEEAKKPILENFKEVDGASKASSSLKRGKRNRRKSRDLHVKDSAAEKSRKSKHASHSTENSEGKLKSFDISAKSSKMHRKHSSSTAKDVLRKSKSANSRVSRTQFKVPEEIGSRNQDLSRSSGKTEGVIVKLKKSMSLNDASDRINVSCSKFRKLPSDLPRVESSLNVPSWSYSIPQPETVWKGEFSIEKCGTLPSSCVGIQAHISTIASDKVPKFAEKLPRKILLEEVTRSSAWPTQFPKNQTTEDNIALYFFANDLESYERSYRKLVESMTQNDLALRGNFDGVELLIFSSNLLPEKSQRWNHLSFLWGVFRRKKGTPNSDPDLRAPSSMDSSLNKCSSGVSCETSNIAPLPELPAVLSVTFVDSCLLKVNKFEQKSTNLNDVDIAEQPEMMPEPFQKGEKYSKRRREIDLNHSADEEYTCKKIKNVRNEDVKKSRDGFSSEICRLGSKFSDGAGGSNGVQSCESKVYSPEYKSTNLSDIGTATKDEHLDRDMLLQVCPSQKGETHCKRRWEIDLNCSPPKEEDSPKKAKNVASDASIISTDLGSTCGSMWLKFPQYPTYSNDTLESRVVNAECSLPVIHGAVLQDDRSKLLKNNDEDVDGPAEILFSLSLALPSYSSSQEQEPQTKQLLPEWRKYIGDQ